MRYLALAVSLFLLTGWSLPEAQVQANKTLVTIGEGQGWCSGTIVSDKYVVTAAHCLPDTIQDNSKRAAKGQPYGYKIYKPVVVTRHLFDAEGNEIGKIEYKSLVYKYDRKYDVAIIVNVSGNVFESWVRINTTPVRFGDKVYAVGNPSMWYGAVSEGHVIKPKLKMNPGYGDIEGILNDAPIMGGSSGGGLFNDKGELIGLTNWGYPGTSYRLASPIINYVRLLNG